MATQAVTFFADMTFRDWLWFLFVCVVALVVAVVLRP
jgi:hypothetical protein